MIAGDEVLCPCGEWVEIEQGINALIPARGHRYHFYSERAKTRALGMLPMSSDAERTHHLIDGLDQVRPRIGVAA